MRIEWWFNGSQDSIPTDRNDCIEVLLSLTSRESEIFMSRDTEERGRRMEHLLGWARAVLSDGRVRKRRAARQPSVVPDGPDEWLASWGTGDTDASG